MLIQNIALVLEGASSLVSLGYVARVADALKRQISEDFAPEWGIDGGVSPFEHLADAPEGYGIIELVSTLDDGLEGYHRIDPNATPHAFVRVDNAHWSVAASHECLEMLADPTGTMLRRALAPNSSNSYVDYLVEICDPCQHLNYSYTLQDGIALSDFYGQDFFDSFSTPGGQYSITNSLKGPRRVLPGGYVCFRDVSGQWNKLVDRGHGPSLEVLQGIDNTEFASYRAMIDRHSRADGHAGPFVKLFGKSQPRTRTKMNKLAAEQRRHSKVSAKRAKRFRRFKSNVRKEYSRMSRIAGRIRIKGRVRRRPRSGDRHGKITAISK
jgi:hypothetical protein